MTITTLTLANELKVTQKTIRMAIKLGHLRATRQRRGREQTTFVITREEADAWKRWRTERTRTRVLPSVRQKGTRQHPKAEHFGFFPNHDDRKMDLDKIEGWKQMALLGDAHAKEMLRLPMEQGGGGVTAWWRAGIGAVV